MVVYDNVEDGSSVCKYNKYTNIALLSVPQQEHKN